MSRSPLHGQLRRPTPAKPRQPRPIPGNSDGPKPLPLSLTRSLSPDHLLYSPLLSPDSVRTGPTPLCHRHSPGRSIPASAQLRDGPSPSRPSPVAPPPLRSVSGPFPRPSSSLRAGSSLLILPVPQKKTHKCPPSSHPLHPRLHSTPPSSAYLIRPCFELRTPRPSPATSPHLASLPFGVVAARPWPSALGRPPEPLGLPILRTLASDLQLRNSKPRTPAQHPTPRTPTFHRSSVTVGYDIGVHNYQAGTSSDVSVFILNSGASELLVHQKSMLWYHTPCKTRQSLVTACKGSHMDTERWCLT
jgi:hypothetical protein